MIWLALLITTLFSCRLPLNLLLPSAPPPCLPQSRSAIASPRSAQARNLKAYGELPATAKINENTQEDGEGDGSDSDAVEFGEDEVDDL